MVVGNYAIKINVIFEFPFPAMLCYRLVFITDLWREIYFRIVLEIFLSGSTEYKQNEINLRGKYNFRVGSNNIIKLDDET